MTINSFTSSTGTSYKDILKYMEDDDPDRIRLNIREDHDTEEVAIWAAKKGYIELIKDININDRKSALCEASRYNNVEVVDYILGAYRVDEYLEPLRLACEFGHIGILGSFIDRGYSVSDPTSAEEAVSNGHINVIRLLLSRSNTQKPYLDRLLGIACRDGHREIAEFLMRKGANPGTSVYPVYNNHDNHNEIRHRGNVYENLVSSLKMALIGRNYQIAESILNKYSIDVGKIFRDFIESVRDGDNQRIHILREYLYRRGIFDMDPAKYCDLGSNVRILDLRDIR